MTRGQVRGDMAGVVILALVGAAFRTTKMYVTRSEPNDRAIGPPARLRFETVRSILEASKGNYWFGNSDRDVSSAELIDPPWQEEV